MSQHNLILILINSVIFIDYQESIERIFSFTNVIHHSKISLGVHPTLQLYNKIQINT